MARKRTKGSTLHKLGAATNVSLGDFSTRAMREYGSFVLMDRAVSDVRDGLKPVQRRILWAMHQLKATADKSFKKSAKVVGDTMGGFHPHGGEAIYGTLVTMVGARYPLIEGQGNFGGPTDSPASMRYCVVGSTLIDTELGLVPIEEIVAGSVKPRLALSLRGEYKPIVRAIDSGVQETLTITTRLGCQITVTPNEPLLVLQGGSLTPEWVLAEDLVPGSTVCLSRSSGIFPSKVVLSPPTVPEGVRIRKVILPSEMTEDLGYLLGYLVAEGTTNNSRVEFINLDSEVLSHYKQCWSSVFPDSSLHEFLHEKSGCTKLECHLASVRSFLYGIGLDPGRSDTKRVPWSILCGPEKSAVSFLRAYFEGDGSSTGVGGSTVSADSKSYSLLKDISCLLLRFGILSSIHRYSSRDINRITLSSTDARLFHDKIGFITAKKRANRKNTTKVSNCRQVNRVPEGLRDIVCSLIQERRVSPRTYRTDDGTTVRLSNKDTARLNKCLYTNRERIVERLSLIRSISVGLGDEITELLSLPYIFDTVSSIEPSGSQKVFDLTVEDTHAYVGNGFVVHNTESRLTKLAELLLEDIAVGEFVPNYSGDLQEPLVLPSRLPLLFLNGSSGIGVGVRAVIPPHNMKELVKVLAYLLRKKNPRLSTALKYLKGPDYGYGVLLSPKEDIESLYATGKGTLRYRCEYEYIAEKKENVLLVKGLAPGFNMSSFLTKMKELHEAGLISYCSDASSAEGVRIHVGFTDPQVIKERVLPELYTSQSYQFYTVKRNEESSLNEETLFSGGLFQLLSEFLDFRRSVERLRLERDLRVERAKLHRVKAVLAALSNLDKVYEVLKGSHKTLGDMRAAMAVALSITDKQAGLILEMKVYRLARMNAESQEKLKVAIRATIVEIKKKLEDIDSVVFSSLKEIVKFSDARGTRVLAQDDAPAIPVSTSKRYFIVQGVKAVRLDKDPSRRHKFDLISTDPSSVLLVYRDNSVTRVGLSYFSEDTLPSVPVGVVPGGSFSLCAIDSRGLLSQVIIPSKSPFNVMRGATTILSAVGVNEGDTLVVVYPSGLCKTLPPSSLERRRAFSLGKKPFPRSKKEEAPVGLLAANPTTRIYSGNGRCVAPRAGDAYLSKSISFEAQGGLFSIGDRNFVLLANEDKRDIVDRKAAVSLLKAANLGKCWPLLK